MKLFVRLFGYPFLVVAFGVLVFTGCSPSTNAPSTSGTVSCEDEEQKAFGKPPRGGGGDGYEARLSRLAFYHATGTPIWLLQQDMAKEFLEEVKRLGFEGLAKHPTGTLRIQIESANGGKFYTDASAMKPSEKRRQSSSIDIWFVGGIHLRLDKGSVDPVWESGVPFTASSAVGSLLFNPLTSHTPPPEALRPEQKIDPKALGFK